MKSRVTLLCLLATLIQPSLARAAYFHGLGGMGDENYIYMALGISGDGSTVVGTNLFEAERWTMIDEWSGETISLGHLPGGYMHSGAEDASADGSVIVGFSDIEGGDQEEAFRWTSSGGMVGLGHLSYGGWSEATAVSADGGVIVGHSNSPAAIQGDILGREAFRWTSGGGMVGIGDLPGGDFESYATAVSADGSVVAGYSESTLGTEAFRWTSGGGMIGLGDLPGGAFQSSARAVSADGSVIVGGSRGASGREAFRWSESIGMVGLGTLDGHVASGARGVSADGSVVVGYSHDATGDYQAFIWDETNGMQNLRDYLIGLGLDMTDWTIEDATGISDDGRTIIGLGFGPRGERSWIAHIDPPLVPEPSTALLVGAGLLGLAVRRRKIA